MHNILAAMLVLHVFVQYKIEIQRETENIQFYYLILFSVHNCQIVWHNYGILLETTHNENY